MAKRPKSEILTKAQEFERAAESHPGFVWAAQLAEAAALIRELAGLGPKVQETPKPVRATKR